MCEMERKIDNIAYEQEHMFKAQKMTAEPWLIVSCGKGSSTEPTTS